MAAPRWPIDDTPVATDSALPLFSETSALFRLSRSSLNQNAEFTSTQTTVDQLTTGVLHEAARLETLGAILAGVSANRLIRLGAMNSNGGHVAAMPLRKPFSIALGIGGEAIAFEGTVRTFETFSSPPQNPNLWRWSGTGGLKAGLGTSLTTFGLLRGAGHVSRKSNLVFQHAFASSAMTAGQNLAAWAGWIPNPEGSLPEQLLHAEAVNIQIGAGTGMMYSVAPGMHALERGLDFTLNAAGARTWGKGASIGLPLLATEGAPSLPPFSAEKEAGHHIQLMAAKGKDGNPATFKKIVTFDRGALSLGGGRALQWLEAVRHGATKEKRLIWIPEEFYQMTLLNEFDLALSEERKELVPINQGERSRIQALPPLLKADEIIRVAKNHREEIQRVLDQWDNRERIDAQVFTNWESLKKQLEAIYAKGKEIRKEGKKRYLIDQEGKKELLAPQTEIVSSSNYASFPQPAEALRSFENQFWDLTPQEMEKRVGAKALRKLPERTIISQFLPPGANYLLDHGKPLRGKKGVRIFFNQVFKSSVVDFSAEMPVNVTAQVPPHVLQYLRMISNMQPAGAGPPSPPPSSPKVETPAVPPNDQAIPVELPEEKATAIAQTPPPPSTPQTAPKAKGKKGIEADPTIPLPADQMRALQEETKLAYEKTSPEGETALILRKKEPFFLRILPQPLQKFLLTVRLKWTEWKINRIYQRQQPVPPELYDKFKRLRDRLQGLRGGNP